MKNTYRQDKISKMLKINKKDMIYYFFTTSIILSIPMIVSILND